jgi:hypothetical protein
MKDQLLYSRIEAGRLLGGISVASLRRLEEAGVLDPVKLSGKSAGQVYYRAKQVHALAGEGSSKRTSKRNGGRAS